MGNIGHSVHGTVDDVAVEPGDRAGYTVENDSFGDKQVKLVDVKTVIGCFIEMGIHMLQPVGNIALRFVKESGDTDGD